MAHPTVQMPTITVGTRLTDFATLDLTVEGLAAGGMGLVVWGKNAAQGNRMRALKLLKPERVAAAARHSPEQRRAIERQFEDEALVWCHLWPHQCVVGATGLTRLLGMGDLPVLQLDYAPNGSLRDQLYFGQQQHTHPALLVALAWAVHIAAALAHMHQPDPDHDRPAPLVHCDLKPENVLLNEHGWAQLTDLGLTRAYAALSAEAGVEAAPGPHPPEVQSAPIAGAPAITSQHAEAARLRAILQAAGAMPPDQSDTVAPSAATLFATHTLRIPPVPPTANTPLGELAAPAAWHASLDAMSMIGSRGPVAGSLPYMAPEQWLGLGPNTAVVPTTDIYAFGVLLYELFAGAEAPHPFPFDPTPFFHDPALAAYAMAADYRLDVLAWHAAHTAPAGSVHRHHHFLTDPEVAAAALRTGPLAELAQRGDASGRQSADAALHQLGTLIRECLAPNPAARPMAATVERRLAALATGPCGLDLDAIPSPAPAPASPRNEAAFWGNLGVTYSKLDRQQEAVAVKRRATQHDPTSPDAWFNLGASLRKLGEDERAQAMEAKFAGERERAGTLITSAQRHFEEALAAYQQTEANLTPEVLTADPTFPAQIVSNRGVALSSLERYAEAVAAYQHALALRPDWHDTRFGLGLTYARWSQQQGTTPAECIERLQAAQRQIWSVLAAAPNYAQARALSNSIARALADPEHRFQG